MPNDIHTSIVDAMRIVRLIPITDVKPRTFRCWAINVLNYLNSLPGTIIHIVFDNYQYEYETPSKNRDSSESERIICDLDQELPITSEWKSFLSNNKNKYQLVNLLVRFILESGLVHSKNMFVNNGNECYYKGIHEETKLSEELSSLHLQADPKIPMHAVYASRSGQ